MDFIQSSNKQVDKFGAGEHGFSPGNPIGGVPATFFSPDWADGVQQEHINVIKAGKLVPSGADLSQAAKAIQRLAASHITRVTAAASPFTATVDHAGTILVDATAGNVAVTLPSAAALQGLALAFRRIDASGNTVTITRAGTDTFDEGGTAFTLASKAVRKIVSDGVSAWSTVSVVVVQSGLSVVSIVFTPFSTPDADFMKCNGTLLPRSTYAALFARASADGLVSEAAWTAGESGRFSVGDGSTTFRLPDLRGEHIRAWDDGRGIDSGRVRGSVQASANLAHTHGVTDPTHFHSISDPSHAHASSAFSAPSSQILQGGVTGAASAGSSTGASTTGISINATSTGISIQSSGGTENRVRNVALIPYIKYI